MNIKTWNIEAMTGYKPITTFYEDFSIADRFGLNAVKDTYRRGLKTAESMGYKWLTEFVMVLNWKIFEHFGKREQFADLYNDLWEQTSQYAVENLTGEELLYYYSTTD